MREKRFTVHIRWYNYEKTEGEIELKDNGQPLLISESIDDVRYIKDLLNEQHEENQALKGQLETYDKGCHEIYKDKCKLEEDNKELREAMKRLMIDLMSK